MKLSVTGAAETGHCGPSALDLAKELGREIARHGAELINGATTGFPLWAAMGAKEAGGTVVGLSPASSEKEHIEKYKLPIEYLDNIIYTGQGYPGRDILMTRTSDGVFIGCGRMGTIHEFTIAFEDNKPIGILEGEWATDELIKDIIAKSHRAGDNKKIVYDTDPKRLVEKVIALVMKDKADTEA